MATYTKTCSNNSSYTLRLELSESDVNITNNTSVITYALYLDSTYPRFEQWNVSYTLDLGSEVSISRTERLSMPDIRGQPLLLTSGSKTVTHDSNGTKSLSVSCSVSTVTSQSYLPGSASISGYTFVLTTIARKSTLYDVSATIDNKITLNVTRQNSNFTHTITYKFGSSSATIVSKSSSLSISWTPPLSLYSQIVGNNSGDGTITIETFNGSASLGSNSYKLTLNAFKIYKTPAISNLRYVRGYTTAGGDWIDYPTSSNIRIKLTTSVVTEIPNNTTDMTVALSNGLTQTRNSISSTDFEIEFDSIGTTTSYTATITLSDTIGTVKTWSITISTVEVPFDINVNLPGIACGKVAETEKAFELAEDWTFKIKGKSLLDFFYPVKTVYITFDNTFDPNEHFGGTWERIRNRFLWAATENGVMGETGGEESHTLTVAEMPSHKGHLSSGIAGGAPYEKGNYKGFLNLDIMTAYGDIGRGWNVYAGNEMHPASEAVGGGQPHNNMPPFIQVAMWKRIA